MVSDDGTRYRAARACKRCHIKRIKCDAIERGMPCTGCRYSSSDECVLMQSKRGTYARTKGKRSKQQQSQSASKPSEHAQHPSSQSISEGRPTYARGSTERASGLDVSTSNSVYQANKPGCHIAASEAAPSSSADADSNLPINSTSPNLDTPISQGSSHREVSWTTMFDQLFDNMSQDRRSTLDKCSITYLGESFPLAMVVEGVKEGDKPRLHHPGPPVSEPSITMEPSGRKHPSHVLPEEITYLEAKGAFTLPEADIMDALVTTFLGRVYPLYPIVSRRELIRQYETDEVPLMLLHAICSIAANFCDISLIVRAGFQSRHAARLAFYSKAKVLFETGYEIDKIVQLQSAVFMTFWGGGPMNHWNYFSWTGTAATIAESLGLHRSMASTGIDPADRSLLKRVWWTLVIRDAHCQSLVGRPFRINQDQVDVEDLTLEDFTDDMRSPEFLANPLRETYGLYQIHMSKLCLILKEIVNARFKSARLASRNVSLYQKLLQWRNELPSALQWVDSDANLDIFALSLCSSYNHHLILLHQEDPSIQQNLPSYELEAPTSVTIPPPDQAAQNISCLVYSIFTKSNPPSLPHETFQGLFLAEAVLFTQLKSSQPTVSQTARTALRGFQMLWHIVLEAWDASPWILRLFDHLIERLSAPPSYQDDVDLVVTDQAGLDMADPEDLLDTFPTLSAFLDMSQGNGALSNWVDFPIFSGASEFSDLQQGIQYQ